MYLDKVNRTTPREIFQLGAYNDDIHHSSAQSETDSHLKCNNIITINIHAKDKKFCAMKTIECRV